MWNAQKHQRAACGNSNLSTENTFFSCVFKEVREKNNKEREKRGEIQLKKHPQFFYTS